MSEARLITHQTQPCPVSCVSTCIAMLKGAPAQEVIDQIHQRYRDGDMTMRAMLDTMQIPFRSFDTCEDAPLDQQGAYLCLAPSLNIVGGNHQIIIEVTEDDYFVIDPVQGREDRRYFVKRGQVSGEFEVELGGFTVEAFVDRAWLEGRAQS